MNTEPNKEGSEAQETTSEELNEVSGGQGEDFRASKQGEDFRSQPDEALKFKPTIWVGEKKE